ncbi:hypothetical protein AcW1_009471 [Taiwanofungus camphoratus]|nr:hypothetical protein AcV7_006939 [Antrodia cinnamomea]KAI0947804.1 hypothetical protein AcW1_009471 [Antrodia cinnamomea]
MQLTGTIVGALLNYVMMLSIIDAQRPALLSISGTRLWSGQNAQSYSGRHCMGCAGPHMFSLHATYHMVPVSLAIGFFLPLPLYLLHRLWPKAGFQNFNACIIMGVGVRVVFRLPVRRDQHAGEHEDRDLLAVVGAHALPAFVHQEQLHRRGGDGRRDAGGAVHPQLCAPCPPDVALRGI